MSWIPSAIGIGSSLATLLGSIGASKDTGYSQINPYTDQQYQRLQNEYAQALSSMQGQQAAARASQAQVGSAAGQAGRVARAEENVQAPGAMDWYDNFLNTLPEYSRIAKAQAESATSEQGRSIKEQEKYGVNEALQKVQDTFGGNAYSGAAQAAAAKAAAGVMSNAETSLAQNKANIQSQAFNNLTNQGQQLSAQGVQNQYQDALSSLAQALQGYQTQGSLYGQQGQLANQGASNASQLVSGGMSGLNQLSQAQYQQNANPFATLTAGANAALTNLTNKNYGYPWMSGNMGGSSNTDNAVQNASALGAKGDQAQATNTNIQDLLAQLDMTTNPYIWNR